MSISGNTYHTRTVAACIEEEPAIVQVLCRENIPFWQQLEKNMAAVEQAAGLPAGHVQQQLEQAPLSRWPSFPLPQEWRPGFLLEAIAQIWHPYLRTIMIGMERLTAQYSREEADLHGQTNIRPISEALLRLYQQQEESAFLYIRQLFSAHQAKEGYDYWLVSTLRKPVRQMIEEEASLMTRWKISCMNLAGQTIASEEVNRAFRALLHDWQHWADQLMTLKTTILLPQVEQLEMKIRTTPGG